jgi:hypothetical protein
MNPWRVMTKNRWFDLTGTRRSTAALNTMM